MCGRFALYSYPDEIIKYFDIDYSVQFQSSYNIAPTQLSPVICQVSATERSLSLMRWGLVPAWVDSFKSLKAPLINARSDTIDIKPSYKHAFRQRRCLVIANGFFEWAQRGNMKQPYFFRFQNNEPMGFAGIWEKWTDDEVVIDSFAIITGEANPLLSAVHDRMPVIIRPEDYSRWLSPETKINDIKNLLVPHDPERIIHFPVTPQMNTPRFNEPDCIVQIK